MLLHWSPRSPFVHKVMVAAEELGLRSKLELTRSVVPTLDPLHQIFDANPLGQIPSLVLKDGRSIYSSLLICLYLQSQSNGRILFPLESENLQEVMLRHALGDGMIETLVAWIMDRILPEEKQVPVRLQRYALKMSKALEAIEKDQNLRPLDRFDVGDIAIATALVYLEFRSFIPGWQINFPKTAEWFAHVSQRSSMLASKLQEG